MPRSSTAERPRRGSKDAKGRRSERTLHPASGPSASPRRETFELRADPALAVDLSADGVLFNINVAAANC